MNKMNIRVAGGGGFLGGRIVRRLLEEGHSVRSLGRSPQSANEALGVEIVQADVADAAAVRRAVEDCQAVFHVAAKAGVWGPYEDYFAANVTGTHNVLEACRSTGVRYLVYTSTPSVTFDGQPHAGADESLPLTNGTPLSHYASTKAVAERMILKGHQSGRLGVCALRPHLIWGVGDPHLVPRVLARARQKRLRKVGKGDNQVDLTHVDNAAHAHLLALDALQAGRAGGRAFFVSDGAPVYLWSWINDLLQEVHIPPVKKHLPYKLAYRLGGVLEFVWRQAHLTGEPPMTRFVASQLAMDHWFDISAARHHLGYAPAVDPALAHQELVDSLTHR